MSQPFAITVLLILSLAFAKKRAQHAIIFVIIGLFLLFLLKKKETFDNNESLVLSKKVPGKTIWLLWLQGWNKAPWLAHQVHQSWEKHNPGWNIELVSWENLHSYVDIPYLYEERLQTISPQAKSDIIRLSLLATHGGIWADASILCMRPLDDWIYEALAPSGLWMYHGRNKGPASWFIASIKQSNIIKSWKEECDKYWSEHSEPHEYLWMDSLFFDLLKSNVFFKREWENVPNICCEDYGQPHVLSNRWLEPVDQTINKIIRENPPNIIKLSFKGPTDANGLQNTNTFIAIDESLSNRSKRYLQEPLKLGNDTITFISDSVLISPDCKHDDSLPELIQLCKDYKTQLILYDKCNFCQHVSNDIYCRPLINKGRDMGTFLYFVIKNYYNLPKTIYFIPANLKKHNRKKRLIQMFTQPNYKCKDSIIYQKNFKLEKYEGTTLEPALVRPFKKWFEKYVGKWDNEVEKKGICWSGVMKTSGEKIRKTPIQTFIELYNQVQVHNSPEVGHYIERTMDVIF